MTMLSELKRQIDDELKRLKRAPGHITLAMNKRTLRNMIVNNPDVFDAADVALAKNLLYVDMVWYAVQESSGRVPVRLFGTPIYIDDYQSDDVVIFLPYIVDQYDYVMSLQDV
jgi:hypothetical protein